MSPDTTTVAVANATRERLKFVCFALGIKQMTAVQEALVVWIDQHEAEALDALAVKMGPKSQG